jgi:glycosyltransferase involved in cell wall biosynthesis
MISILIPVYNDPVGSLVNALHTQCIAEGITFEIICLDDCSRLEIRQLNAPLAQLPQVQYRELPENLGRSRIRNRLAGMAQYPYLLFTDGDSGVVRSDYIRNYLPLLHPEKVIYGGRVYSRQAPVDVRYRLHWRYGSQREALDMEARNAHPYRTFMTNNFVVPQVIFQDHQFDETIRRYGYEDTLYGLALQKAGITIVHTDNPLEHLGLESRDVFLHKIGEALDNLAELLPRYPELDTRLLSLVRQLEDRHLLPLLREISPFILPIFKNLMKIEGMPMRVLDAYKLFYFLEKK